MKPQWIFAFGAFVLLVCTIPSYAQWSTDPTVNNAICAAPNPQAIPTIVSDGAGGAIITWFDFRSGNYDIYAQRINASGVVQWTAGGIAVCTATNHQEYPTIASDSVGGAIILWYDLRSGRFDLYAQRINTLGEVQWTADGVAICTAGNNQSDYPSGYFPQPPDIVSDGAGGAIVTWQDHRTHRNNIYAQRINASGEVQWPADGVAISPTNYSQMYPTIASDGAGGAIITWQDGRNNNWDIYAQRINASGVLQWPADGIAICITNSFQQLPTIINDGAGGAIITWGDHRNNSDLNIYAQRIDASGVVQWPADGVAICLAMNIQTTPTIVNAGAGDAIITWYDFRSNGNYDIYAQRINASGTVQWTTDGVAICTAMNHQAEPTIVSDGAAGAIITWFDYRNSNWDIFAQRINASGAVEWASDGVAICMATNDQYRPAVASDEAGGAIVTWHDLRNGSADIYAQRVCSDGTLGGNSAPFATAGADQTVIVNETVQLDGSGSSDPDNNSLTFAWTITLKPAGSNAALSNPASVTPTFVADVAGEYRVSLVVNDGIVNSAADEVVITVITAQDAIGNLIDQINDLVTSGDLEANQAKPLTDKLTAIIALLDKDKTEVAINQLETFINMVNADINSGQLTPEQGQPLIDAANAIIAALRAGGTLPKNIARDFLDRTDNMPPAEFLLEQNSPNPFNPVTTIQFSMPRTSHVRLKVYNSFGAEVVTLVDQQIAPGTYKVNWDASHMASGFYLYRLEAEGLALTKKLLLMK